MAGFLLAGALVLGVIGFAMGGRPSANALQPLDAVGTATFRAKLNKLSSRFAASSSSAPASSASAAADTSAADTSAAGAGRRDAAAHGANVPDGDIRALSVDVGAATVYIGSGSGYDLQVEGGPAYTSELANGVWKVRTDKLTGDRSNVVFRITVPQGTQLQSAQLTIGAGSMYIDTLSCASALLEVGAGKLEAAGLRASGDVQLEAGLGAMTVSGELLGRTQIDCGMGSVKLSLARPASYGYSVSCGMGSVLVDGSRYAGFSSDASHNPDAATFFELNCGMGSVELSFQS